MEAAALQGETNGGGGMGRRGAHLKHAVHARDARRVETQRQVERIRALPSPKGGHSSEGGRRARRREGVGAAAQVTRGVGPKGGWVAWAGAERTESRWSMLVKLEVSKVSGWLNACAPCQNPKGGRLRGRQAGQETGGR